MDSLLTLQHCRRILHLPLPSKPPSPLRFRSRLPISPPPSKSSSSVRSSSASPPSSAVSFRQTPLPQTSHPISSSILKTASLTLTAAAALFFLRFTGKPAVAAPIPPATVESENKSRGGEEDKVRALEEQLKNNPNDVEALRSLMEVRFKTHELPESANLLDRLIKLDPKDLKWAIWRGFAYKEMGDYELARKEFERVLAKDPSQFRAYQGLVIVIKSSGSGSLKAMLKRVERALENCKEFKKGKLEIRRFKLLIAQIKFMERSFYEALKDYEELEREDPLDFRPYLSKGVIYMALGKYDEADKHFEISNRLIHNHSDQSYLGGIDM